MTTLIVADIHANYRALKAVLDAFGSADEIWCLGDVVSYGPCPQQCIELVRDACRHVVRGNHDTPAEAGAVDAAGLEYLRGLPLTLTVGREGISCLLLHGSPADPLCGYLRPNTTAQELARNGGQREEARIYCGHTHMAMLLDVCGKRVVNAGTIGQPRDGDCRAQCVLIEGDEHRFERVAYDQDALADDYRRSGLPEDQKQKWLRNTLRGFWDEHGLQLGPFTPADPKQQSRPRLVRPG